MTAILLVALGGFVGATLRYHVDRLVRSRLQSASFPWGTLVVNLVGCFVLGALVAVTVPAGAAMPGGHAYDLLGTGLCGALTTYSTFGYETLRLVENGARLQAVANAVVSVFAGLGTAFVGYAVGAALSSLAG